jgi:hypothetical protein
MNIHRTLENTRKVCTQLALAILLCLATTLSAQQDSSKVAWKIKSLAIGSILPEATQLANIKIARENILVNFDVPPRFLKDTYSEELHEELVETITQAVADFGILNIFINAKNAEGKYIPISYFFTGNLPPVDIPKSYSEVYGRIPMEYSEKSALTFPNKAQPFGHLYGKTVWLSPGHGWLYNNNVKRYITQRGNNFGLVEDFSNEEAVNYYLLKYLYNAGANVWSVRERDMNTHEIIVDNDDGAPSYSEVGTWGSGSASGYKGKTYRFSWTKNKEDAQAIFRPDIPEAGWYWVSVWYYPSKNRGKDVRFKVQHAGGESVFSVDEQAHGETWVYLGQFYFEKGDKGSVVVSNESSQEKGAVIADAVRFGGGMAQASDCDYTSKTLEAPRHEMSARYYTQYMGFPDCKNDVTVRPAYAEWELAKGSAEEKANAIYFSWHTNASGGTGTESFVHTFRSSLKSRKLRELVHDQLVGDIRKGWDPNWKDRGKKSADLGELRGVSTMPATLVEIGFHDNEKDAEALSTPAFRQLAARSIYKGITRYFALQDGRTPTFLPEPPTHLHALNNGEGNITVSWKTPAHGGVLGDAATKFKVYLSQHGKAFGSDGQATSDSTYTFTGLAPEKTYYFRVTALNAGGESFPTAVVAVRTPKKDQAATMLLVDGFDRLDRWSAVKKDFPHLGEVNLLHIDRMNNYDYAADVARSVGKLGIAFDGTTNEAVEAKQVGLSKYKAINWFLGEESTQDETLSNIEQSLLANYLDKGGNLIISGSELAYHLDKKKAGRDFYRKYLKATFAGDNAGTAQFEGDASGPAKGVKGDFDKKGMGYYLVDYPDYLKPYDGSKALLNYANGRVAAVGYKGKFGLINAGFPLEMISDERTKDELYKKLAAFLEIIPETPPIVD